MFYYLYKNKIHEKFIRGSSYKFINNISSTIKTNNEFMDLKL